MMKIKALVEKYSFGAELEILGEGKEEQRTEAAVTSSASRGLVLSGHLQGATGWSEAAAAVAAAGQEGPRNPWPPRGI